VGTAVALAAFALVLAAGAVAVWRWPLLALYLFLVGLALHNAVMDALWAAGLHGRALTVVEAWKEVVLAVALARVATDAVRARALPFRFGIVDALALAFGAAVVVYALVPQSSLGGSAGAHAVALGVRNDLVPVAAYFLGRSLRLGGAELRRLAWTALGVAAVVAALGLVDVYAVSIGWWRTNGTVGYFRHLGFRFHGTGGLPENFVYNTGSEQHFLRRLVSTFLSPLGSAYLFVVALLLAAGLLRRRAAVALVVVAAAGLLWTFSRASLVALAAGLVVLAVARRHPLPLVAAAATIGIAFAWVHVFPSIGPTGHWTRADLVYQRQQAKLHGPQASNPASPDESSLREHWTSLREGVRTVVHHPQGYGLGNAGETALRSGTTPRAGESTYTQLGVEVGVVGGILWLAWSLALLVGLLRSRREWAPAVAAAFAAVLAVAVQTDILGVPWVTYCVWGLAGTLLALRPVAQEERAPASAHDAAPGLAGTMST
jgi:O-Antigen ligase